MPKYKNPPEPPTSAISISNFSSASDMSRCAWWQISNLFVYNNPSLYPHMEREGENRRAALCVCVCVCVCVL